MKLQNLKSLSTQYSISIFTFRKFVKMGMPHYRLGNKILVNPKEFEDWFEKYKVVARTQQGILNRLVENALFESD